MVVPEEDNPSFKPMTGGGSDCFKDLDSRRSSAQHRASRDSSFAEGAMEFWMSSHSVHIEEETMSPKNPEVLLPLMLGERPLADWEWASLKFPSFPIPTSVVTNVKVSVWEEVMRGFRCDSGEFLLMQRILDDLTLGCDSRVR